MQSGPAVENQAPLQVEPLEGWSVHTCHGLQRCGELPDDRLVLLTTVAIWLMKEKEIPLKVAAERIKEKINEDTIEYVYFLDGDQWAWRADLETPYSKFSIFRGKRYGRGKNVPFPECYVYECTDFIDFYWFSRGFGGEQDGNSPFECLEKNGGGYAIRISKAYELWGWGRVAGEQANAPRLRTFADLVAYRKTAAGLEWTPEQRAILAAEYQQPGMSMTKLAQALNVSRQAIKVQIDKHAAGELGKRERGKQKGNHANIVAFPLKAVNARQ